MLTEGYWPTCTLLAAFDFTARNESLRRSLDDNRLATLYIQLCARSPRILRLIFRIMTRLTHPLMQISLYNVIPSFQKCMLMSQSCDHNHIPDLTTIEIIVRDSLHIPVQYLTRSRSNNDLLSLVEVCNSVVRDLKMSFDQSRRCQGEPLVMQISIC